MKLIKKVQAVANSIDSLKTYGYDQFNKSADLGVKMFDACLENKYAKLLTDPVLTFTEKSLNYWLPESDSDYSINIIFDLNIYI